jgi:hypothetical protein
MKTIGGDAPPKILSPRVWPARRLELLTGLRPTYLVRLRL